MLDHEELVRKAIVRYHKLCLTLIARVRGQIAPGGGQIAPGGRETGSHIFVLTDMVLLCKPAEGSTCVGKAT